MTVAQEHQLYSKPVEKLKQQIYYALIFFIKFCFEFTLLLYIHTTTHTDDNTNVACSLTEGISVQSYSLSGATLLEYRVPNCDIIKFSFFVFQDFHYHISIEHDEKPSHTKFYMNRFMVA